MAAGMDFRPGSSFGVGAGAHSPPSLPEIHRLVERLEDVAARLGTIIGTVSETANRVLGSVPEGEEARTWSASQGGTLGIVHARIDSIMDGLAVLDRVANRLAQL